MSTHATKSTISLTTIGLAIFSMLFGAGNIIYPIKAGVMAGTKNFYGMIGFLLTGAFLPVLGLVAMILFGGDFKAFFYRLGKIPGFLAILFCMIIIGPLIAMPRCITVPYDMVSIFLPDAITLPIFSALFCFLAFCLTYRESKLLIILGNFIGPVKVISLSFIAAKGVWNAYTLTTTVQTPEASNWNVFLTQFAHGFQTLDLLGTLFFAYIIMKILGMNNTQTSTKQLALISLKGGMIGAGLLTAMYISYSYIGAWYGFLVDNSMNGAQIFQIISLHIIGKHGAFMIMLAALMACLSTASALATIFAQYLSDQLARYRIGYIPCLIVTLTLTSFISNFGLTNILNYSAPYIELGYPIIVAITLCNVAYKLFGFSWIKLPVAATTILMIALHIRA